MIEIHALNDSLSRISNRLISHCQSSIPLMESVCHHLLKLGGKHLRARLALLATGACGHALEQGESLALIVEWLHTATLLHDDVIDQTDQRRSEQATQTVFGNTASVLGGDYLYALAFEHIATLNHPQTLSVLAQATRTIVEGEMHQLAHRYQRHLNRANYLKIIEGKTAKLFEVSTQLPAIYLSAPSEHIQALTRFGHDLGTIYQMIDDLLDYQCTSKDSGKTQYSDLHSGLCTFPLIVLAEHTDSTMHDLIEQALNGDSTAQESVKTALHSHNTFNLAWAEIITLTQAAQAHLDHIPNTPYRTALKQILAEFIETHAPASSK